MTHGVCTRERRSETLDIELQFLASANIEVDLAEDEQGTGLMAGSTRETERAKTGPIHFGKVSSDLLQYLERQTA
jgi:hypothetical protein